MASPAEIARVLPETLPDDFVEWDSGDSSAKRPVESGAREAGRTLDATPKHTGQLAEPKAQTATEPKTVSLPMPTNVSPDREVQSRGLTAIAMAVDKKPLSPAQMPANIHGTRDVFFAPVRPKANPTGSLWNASFNLSTKVDGPLSALSPLAPTGVADDEAFLGQLKAIGTVLNTQPISTSQKRGPAPAVNEVSPPQISPAHIQSSDAAPLRWPAKPVEVTATVDGANLSGSSPFQFGFVKSEADQENLDRKKFIRVAAIGATVALVVFLGFRLLSPGKPTLAKQTVEVRSADAAATAETHETSSSAETGGDKLLMTGKPQQAANPSNAARPQADLAPQVDSQSMNDQLTASPLIPRDIKTKAKEDAPPPPSFAAANADDLGNNGTIGALLSEQSKPSVHYAPDAPTILSAAAAEKLLIQRKAPVYPPKAWKYYVSGKVALEAIVSKTGTVKSLKVLSGKPEFEQASLEAVRNWHYKPYLVNNEPVEFQTTINLTFDANK